MQNQPPQVVAPEQLKLPKASSRKERKNLLDLPPIPDKLYFTIGEVADLCLVKPYVLRYWEREFAELNPTTRRGKRRYYQHNDILLIRRIKSLLYEHGFTIDGARTKLSGANKNDQNTATNLNAAKLTKNVISQLTNILSELNA